MADSNQSEHNAAATVEGKRSRLYLIVVLIAAAIYLGCIFSPPSLMDDVDAVQATIARNMLQSGDWVTARLDGIAYLEKAPLVYWVMAASYRIFGVHDWAARLPIALAVMALAWLTAAYGFWAFEKEGDGRAGFYAGLCMATCIGLFLFTRILIPDVMLTFTIALAFWSFQRALHDDEQAPQLWAWMLGISLGVGLLLKSMISVAIPVGGSLAYLIATKQFSEPRTWRRLRLWDAILIILVIAAPWHIFAAIRNPPIWVWTFHSGPGQYHGFLWFYFMNEQVLRFLNLRYPHDYDTVPRLYFWLYHLVWLFPWSVYLPAVAKLQFRPTGPEDRAAQTRLLAMCWAGFVLIFFTFSTTQEYYSMPCYPALALLLGCAMAKGGAWIRGGTRVLAAIATAAAVACLAILYMVRHTPAPGDIVTALTSNPQDYRESLGHMADLTIPSFAYLRLPLTIAAVAFLIGGIGSFVAKGRRAFLAAAVMMVVFFHAARVAMISFDPLLSTKPLADALLKAPPGTLIAQGHFYEFSSVFFYSGREGLLSTDRRVNLEYGSFAPGAPQAFLEDHEVAELWRAEKRCYLLVDDVRLPKYQSLIGPSPMYTVAKSGGKFLFTNEPVP